jgi:D-alanyl-D-alanine carboxypeptidase/D-alanyl-D-alanine-endopeptidase (penicillin-binding protein 4)
LVIEEVWRRFAKRASLSIMRFALRSNMGRAAHLRRLAGLVTLVGGLFGALAVPSARADLLAQRLGQALAVPHLVSSQTGAIAIDLRTGRKVYSLNEGRGLLPASTEKLGVAFAALQTLGPDFRIETDVLGQGQIDGTTWNGDLVLKGFGDPTLSRADLQQLAHGVREFGIRRVTGGVVGDESYFDGRRIVAGWKASYLIEESPPLSALIVDRGLYGGRVTTSPALASALLFRAALRAAGVVVAGAARASTSNAADFPLAFVHSARLSALVRYMGVESDNFTAEMLLKQLGAQDGGYGTSSSGAAVVTAALRTAGVPLGGVRVVDGSGLSLLNRLTAASLATLLQVAWVDPVVRASFLPVLPVAGVSGTLRDRLRRPPARGRVLAKTGTTNGASALAGYVTGHYAFAVLHNGQPVATFWARRAQDRFVTVLAASE